MKRKTITAIHTEINNIPLLTLKKRPRKKLEITSLTSSVPFPLCKAILFHISSFLVPEKTSNLHEFLKSLRNDTLILHKISKKIREQNPINIIIRHSLDNFSRPMGLNTAHWEYLLASKTRETFLSALDLLETRFLYWYNKWPYLRVFHGNAMRLWKMTQEDLDWVALVFKHDSCGSRRVGMSCSTHELAWAAMVCHPPSEDVNVMPYYVSPPHHKVRESQRQENEFISIQKKNNKKQCAIIVKKVTNWPIVFFERTLTFKHFSTNLNVTEFTQDIQDSMKKEMFDMIFDKEFGEKIKLRSHDHNDENALRLLLISNCDKFVGEKSLKKWRETDMYKAFVLHVEEQYTSHLRMEWYIYLKGVVHILISSLGSKLHVKPLEMALDKYLQNFEMENNLEDIGRNWLESNDVKRVIDTLEKMICSCGNLAAQTCILFMCAK